MTTFLRYLKVSSFIILVAALSIMPACGSEEPVAEGSSDLSSSYMEQLPNYVAACDTLEYTIHIVNNGSATQAEATVELSPLLIHVSDSEWASDGDVQYDPDEGSIRLQGDIPADGEILFGWQAVVKSSAAGQSVLTECYIYDIPEDKEYKLEETTTFHPGIEYRWDECDCNPPMRRDECDVVECLPSSQEKTHFDEAGVPTHRSITQYECDSMGRRITEEKADFDEQGAPIGGSATEYEYDSVGNRISEETANFDKQGAPTGGIATEYEYDSLNRLISMETTNLDDEGTPTGSATTEFEYDPEGNLVTEETTNCGDLAVEAAGTTAAYEYDDWGRLIGALEDNIDSTGALTGSTLTDYEYDGLDRKTQESVKKIDVFGEQISRTVTRYEYDLRDRRTKVSVSNRDKNDKHISGRLTEYKYTDDVFDLIAEVSVKNLDESDKQISRTVTDYEYDQSFRISKAASSYRDENDSQTDAQSIEYKYDADGRIIEATISTYDGSNTLTHRKVLKFKYDEQGKMTEVTSQYWDPAYDLYGSDGSSVDGPEWQNITEIEAVCTDETLTFTFTVDDDFPNITDFSDGAIMIVVDIDGDGEVVPSEGLIDFYGGNLDFGIFVPWPGFGEPPIFIEYLHGGGAYDTTGATYNIDAENIEIEVELEHIGDPQGPIRFVGAIRTGITSVPTEDRVPNEGLAEIPGP